MCEHGKKPQSSKRRERACAIDALGLTLYPSNVFFFFLFSCDGYTGYRREKDALVLTSERVLINAAAASAIATATAVGCINRSIDYTESLVHRIRIVVCSNKQQGRERERDRVNVNCCVLKRRVSQAIYHTHIHNNAYYIHI